jgi:hypothetical protein
MRNRAAIAIIAVMAMVPASGQESGTKVRVAQGAVEVDAVFVAPDTCHRIINAGPGAPAGHDVASRAIAATVRIAREEGRCEQRPTPLTAPFALPDNEGKNETVQLFYIDREGQVLSSEQVRIPR